MTPFGKTQEPFILKDCLAEETSSARQRRGKPNGKQNKTEDNSRSEESDPALNQVMLVKH